MPGLFKRLVALLLLARAHWSYALIDSLLKDYQMDEPPMINRSTPVAVNVRLIIQSLQHVEERDQVAAMKMWFGMRWDDHRLAWDPKKYGGVTDTSTRISNIWTPDILIRNEYGSARDQIHGESLRAELSYNGSVWFWPVIDARLSSILKLTYFPFDKQLVYIHLCSWTAPKDRVTFHVDQNVTFINFHLHWDIIKTDYFKPDEIFDGKQYDAVIFTVLLKRKPMFYIYSIVMPCCILSILSAVIFAIPPTSGERITYGITILLSFTVLQLTVADSLPRTSEISLLSIYMAGISVIVGMSVVASILTLNICRDQNTVTLPSVGKEPMQLGPTMYMTEMEAVSRDNDKPYNQSVDNSGGNGRDVGRHQLDPRSKALLWDKFCFTFFLITLVLFTVSVLVVYPSFDDEESFDAFDIII